MNSAVNPLIRAAALAGYEELANEVGLAPATQLRRAGLSLAALREPEQLIPYPSMIALLEQSAQAAGRPDFGLQLSQQQGLSILGPLAVIAQNADDVAQAYELAGRYMFVYSPAIRVTVEPVGSAGRWIDLCFDIDIVPRPVCVQAMELGVGVMVNCARLLAQGESSAREILIPHARPKGSTRHEEVLGAPCRFSQSRAALRFAAEDVRRPMRGSNPMLREMAQRYIDTQFVAPNKPFSDRVRQVIHRLLGTERCSHQSVSEMLAMHPRTMQRRLGEEGTSFEKIKDEVRRSVVESVMRSTERPSLNMLMAMLDYADASTLTRSCRRWFGVPPTALRSGVDLRAGMTRKASATIRRPG
ncbi:AraC family transcriptional regulator [Variovorax sp. J22R24]|uniref:AraC family transcriptional regulator n=1 Tax=Variovorax gracilis TaxID=3053502 RepID=UPI002578CF3D|nr:AraC family transcriptional regulator [Variovorax sp. J22R24]MDM0108586.1 AraC family transcriptional regulator [Variovorax sp. J22R24]